jgi:hypothetical protein
MEQFVVDQQHIIFANDVLQGAQTLTSETNTPADISAKFYMITYSKGRPTDFLETLSTITKSFSTVSHIYYHKPFCSYCFYIKKSLHFDFDCIYTFLNSRYHHNNIR